MGSHRAEGSGANETRSRQPCSVPHPSDFFPSNRWDSTKLTGGSSQLWEMMQFPNCRSFVRSMRNIPELQDKLMERWRDFYGPLRVRFPINEENAAILQIQAQVISAVIERNLHVLFEERFHGRNSGINLSHSCVMHEHVRKWKHPLICVRRYRAESFDIQFLKFMARYPVCRVSTMHDATLRGTASSVASQVKLNEVLLTWKSLWKYRVDLGFRNLRSYNAELLKSISKELVVAHLILQIPSVHRIPGQA